MQAILGVAVGVILVFAMFAVVASSATEGVSALVKRRARDLERGIARMLDDADRGEVSAAVLGNPVIKALSNSRAKGGEQKKPSYLDAVTFTTALLEASRWSEQLIVKLMPDGKGIASRLERTDGDSAIKTDLKKKWEAAVTADRTAAPPQLAGKLMDDPDQQRATSQLAVLLGSEDEVTSKIEQLKQDGDPSAAEIERRWNAAGHVVGTFATGLMTTRWSLATRTATTDIQNALNEIEASNPFVGRILLQLWRKAGEDFVQFRRDIEDWFDRQMDRVSGWYARWAQVVMFLVALALAVALNVSATTIGRGLWADPTLRANATAFAQRTTTTDQPGQGDKKQPTFDDLDDIGLPLGWNKTAWPGSHDLLELIIHLAGVVAVAVAASFGAPFWFDLLNRVVNLRVAGPKPLTAAEQRTEGKGAASQP